MKKLIIICEGQTEQMFCDRILKSHFANLGINIQYPLIAHSNGGIVKWANLKSEIETFCTVDTTIIVTTFIDYYGIEDYHCFPEWANAHLEVDKTLRMGILENGMTSDLSAPFRTMFIPNIQLHEFEALVLADFAVFGTYYAPNEFNDAGLLAICALDPETVNNGLTTAPSKRLKSNIPGYDKVNDGSELAKIIGLPTIRAKCPRFNDWITNLESI